MRKRRSWSQVAGLELVNVLQRNITGRVAQPCRTACQQGLSKSVMANLEERYCTLAAATAEAGLAKIRLRLAEPPQVLPQASFQAYVRYDLGSGAPLSPSPHRRRSHCQFLLLRLRQQLNPSSAPRSPPLALPPNVHCLVTADHRLAVMHTRLIFCL